MTDGTDDSRDEPEERKAGSTSGSRVPPGGSWELITQVHYDTDRPDGLTIAIIEAVAEAEGVPPKSILDPPLYESVDAAELESTFIEADAGEDASPDAGSVEFMYRGHRVVVRRDGWILVYERA